MSTSTRHFIRHYVEMLVAMFAGMVVLGTPALLALGAAGVSSAELRSDAPAVLLLGMGVSMTVPMVAWMRHRGHGWQPSNEMAASMMIPTVGDYVTPKLVGGKDGVMIATAIEAQFKRGANWPLGAALSVVTMTVVTMMALAIVFVIRQAGRRAR